MGSWDPRKGLDVGIFPRYIVHIYDMLGKDVDGPAIGESGFDSIKSALIAPKHDVDDLGENRAEFVGVGCTVPPSGIVANVDD